MESNLSLYAVPASWLVSISAHWYAAYLTSSSPDLKFFDNSAPREFLTRVRAQEKQTPVVGKYLRAEAAQQNGFENVPLFAAAVLAGNFAGLPVSTMNLFSGVYVGTRVVYNFLYINSTTRKGGAARSVTYLVGLLSCLGIFIKAGNALNRGPALLK